MPPDASPAPSPRRVHIVGGPGSGKTTLARRIGDALGLPVHHLDDVYRVGGGTGPLRPETDRRADVKRILGEPGWVTEGIHLGWTDPFFEAADLVVWLDTVGWARASGRLVRRFAAGATRRDEATTSVATASVERVDTAAATPSSRRSARRRVSDGVGHARDLVHAIGETRHYHLYPRGTANLPETRAATRDRLDGQRGQVVRCRREVDVSELLRSLGMDA